MPRMMLAYNPLEFIMLPDITYIALEHMNQSRRIYTDGREWPAKLTPTFVGTSIGKWLDEDGDSRFDVLTIETRASKAHALSIAAACRSTATTRRSLKNASIATRPMFFTTKSRPSTMRSHVRGL